MSSSLRGSSMYFCSARRNGRAPYERSLHVTLMIQSRTSSPSVSLSWRSTRLRFICATSRRVIDRRSSSVSASKTMISSRRLMNSGLKVRLTSPSTCSLMVLVSVASPGWKPSDAFFWM